MTKGNNNLDHMFDELTERLHIKGQPLNDVYNLGPLASDHLILNKSWDYFRLRVKTMEEEWQNILKAKEEQISALTAEVQIFRKEADSLKEKQTEYETMERMIHQEKLDEIQNARRRTGDSHRRWEEEKQDLEEKCSKLERKIAELEKLLADRDKKYIEREANFLTQIKLMRVDAEKAKESLLKAQNADLVDLKVKDEQILSMEHQLELMAEDQSRRDDVIHLLNDEKKDLIVKLDAGVALIKKLEDTNLAKDREIDHLNLTVNMQKKEISDVRSDLARQQAEWRELWDRERGLWENAKKNNIDTV